MSSSQGEKIEKLTKPSTEISDTSQFKEDLRAIVAIQRKLDGFGDTLERRKSAAENKHQKAIKPLIAELQPLLDRVFWHVYIHWNELRTGKATESIKFDDATFKRRIDTLGTIVADKKTVAEYLYNIESSDFALKLRHEAGTEKANLLLEQMKGLVTPKIVPELNTDKLKEFLVNPDTPEIEGASVRFTNTLTLIPVQSPSQTSRGRKPTTTVRQIP